MPEDLRQSSDDVVSQYYSLTKQDVIIESSCFNDRNFSPRTCQQVLTKLIYLFDKGEKFTEDELSTLFFSITKLFQSEDNNLKRLLYLTIKYMKDTPSICMITNCVTKDVSSTNPNIKANALRLLPLIIESQNPIQLERNLKLSLVNKSKVIVDAALIACTDIFRVMPDVIKKCSEEIMQILINSKESTLQYKSFILLQEIKTQDPISLIKLLQTAIDNKHNYSSITIMYIIRAVEVFVGTGINSENRLDQKSYMMFIKFLRDCVDTDNALIKLEAAKVLTALDALDNKTLQPVVEKLSNMLIEENTTIRYSVLKIFNNMIKNPFRVSLFKNYDQIQELISNPNKNIMAMAVSVLVKVASPENLQELVDRVYGSLDDLPLSIQKSAIANCIDVVRKDSKSLDSILKFLWNCLKEKGGVDLKLAVIDIMRQILELKLPCYTIILEYFAEYIEDSMDNRLTLAILDLMCIYLPKAENPKGYLKYLINRLTLDKSIVRTAVVTCMAQIATQDAGIRVEVIPILEHLQFDFEEEEVRERASYYLRILHNIEDNHKGPSVSIIEEANELSEDIVESIIHRFEDNLAQQNYDTSFLDFNALLKQAQMSKKIHVDKQKDSVKMQNISNTLLTDISKYEGENDVIENETRAFFENKPEFKNMGSVMITTSFVDISEPETEVFIKFRKHLFENNVLFEFLLQNNGENAISDLVLDLNYEPEETFEMLNIVAEDSIEAGQTGKIFVSFSKSQYIVTGEFVGTLQFTVQIHEAGKIINSYQDELPLEEFNIKLSDFVSNYPFHLTQENFSDLWNSLKTQPAQQNYQLDFDSISSAVQELSKTFGMAVVGDSHVDASKNFHSFGLAGLYLQKHPVLIECKVGFDQNKRCITSLSVKSNDEQLSEAFLDI